MTTPRIAFIGAGNMAASLIGGLRAQGFPADAIRASDPGAEQRAKISAEHGIGRLRRGELETYKSPVAMDVMRAIKATLDPNGIMNPGKVL